GRLRRRRQGHRREPDHGDRQGRASVSRAGPSRRADAARGQPPPRPAAPGPRVRRPDLCALRARHRRVRDRQRRPSRSLPHQPRREAASDRRARTALPARHPRRRRIRAHRRRARSRRAPAPPDRRSPRSHHRRRRPARLSRARAPPPAQFQSRRDLRSRPRRDRALVDRRLDRALAGADGVASGPPAAAPYTRRTAVRVLTILFAAAWVASPTSAQPAFLVADLNENTVPGKVTGFPVATVGGHLIVLGQASSLWSTDGTEENLVQITDGISALEFAQMNEILYFLSSPDIVP